MQPIASIGLAVLAIACHYYLNEEMKIREWIGVCLAFYYTIKLASTFDYGEKWHGFEEDIQGWEMAFSSVYIMLMAATAVIAGNFIQSRLLSPASKANLPGSPNPNHMAPASMSHDDASDFSAQYMPSTKTRQDVLIGFAIGTIFGLSASMSKVGFLLALDFKHNVFSVAGVLISIAITASGVTLRNEAMKRGATMVICSTAAMANLFTTIFVGVAMLGDGLPDRTWDDAAAAQFWNIVYSWCGMLVATALLASVDRTSGQLDEEKMG